MNGDAEPGRRRSWVTRSVLGFVFAAFFSDFSHEMATAVLPLYLAASGLGPAALGMIEGLADFVVSLAKLGGGVLGHVLNRRLPWVAGGYLATSLATASMAFTSSLPGLVSLRCLAWLSRGIRSPIRDDLLADAVAPTHYGRAYGLERVGDMLGAVVGPFIAGVLIWLGLEFRSILLVTLIPGLFAALAIGSLVRERPKDRPVPVPDPDVEPSSSGRQAPPSERIPRRFYLFLIGVLLFGLGDFSRTFLIWLAAGGKADPLSGSPSTLTFAVLLYSAHNLISAAAAYPIGHLGDRTSRSRILVLGYGLGVLTNVWLASFHGSFAGVAVAVVLSGIYIAVEETLEKAVVAEWLPRSRRSLGMGFLACANAIGDMVSSLYVGLLLEAGRPSLAFSIAAALGGCGIVWLVALRTRLKPPPSPASN